MTVDLLSSMVYCHLWFNKFMLGWMVLGTPATKALIHVIFSYKTVFSIKQVFPVLASFWVKILRVQNQYWGCKI